MAIKITFSLHTLEENYDNVVSNIQRIEGLELKEARDKKGDIICSATVSEENAERTANLCGSMCNTSEVESMKIYVALVADKETKKQNPLLPYIPMILSSAVTFLVIYGVLGTLGQDLKAWDVFNLAGIPTIVVFLSQLGYATQELWIQALRKKPSR